MRIGYDHCPKNLIPEADIVQHRLDFDLDFSMTDSQLRHELLFKKHRDNIIYTNSIDLATVLHQCKFFNIVPIIALNFFWYTRYIKETRSQWVNKITPAQLGRCANLVSNLITEYGFKEYYLSVLNEPTKWLNNEQIYQYSKATLNKKIKIIVGNDEFKSDMFDYLASRFAGNPNVVIGYHALSSMGTWKNPMQFIGRIDMMKSLADNYKLAIIGNECGSWFVSYRIEQGHNINKQIIMECKNAGYIACLIVLPDININSMNRYKLGYRVWSNSYKTLKMESDYYNDFINFIKQEGEKKMVEYIRPEQLQLFYDEVGWVRPYNEDLPNLPIVGRKNPSRYITWADLDAIVESLIKAMFANKNYPNIKYDSNGNWISNWQTYAKGGGVK